MYVQLQRAPVVLFVYNRPDHTRRVLAALAANSLISKTQVYVFADGPKEKATENDKQKIEAVRVLLREFNLFPITAIFEAEVNLGLADSIINGVSKLLDSHETVIVVEDDLDLSPYFLDYMNRALDCYRFDARVISIGACNFFGEDDGLPETFFLPVPDCWGWATWKNRWLLFEKDAS